MNNNISRIEQLALSGKKVFTTEDLAVIWQIPQRRKLIESIKYYLREKRLTSIHKGVYAYGEDYTPLDIAQKLVPLSYISLYTTSQMHGLTFQYYETIYCMSLKSKKYTIKGQKYVYRKLKEPVFYNQTGLVDSGRYFIADKERTITDCLYVFPGFAFDNLQGVDTEKLLKLSRIYNNKRLEREVKKIC
jgi:predicted transcriptional regulator of viral defense system